MDILTKHKVGSDLPLMEKQRNPIYKTKNKTKSFGMESEKTDNLTDYVRRNLKDTVKPRSKEYR